MKKNSIRQTELISLLLILFPVLTGIFLYNRLPQKMATHFGMTNMPNAFSNKLWVIIGLPFLGIILQVMVFLILRNQKETKNLDFKIVNITLWLVPVITNIVNLSLYAYALGHKVKGSFILSAFLGLFFIIFGNYLPKVSPNRSVGIRLPWTLRNSTNWHRTQHFAGWLFFISGIVLLLTSYWEMYWIVIAVVIIDILLITCYSYSLSKNGY
ncbi:hypothetical protein LACWKB8_1348 [Lactobacillus sp. wkB8]|uniref:SdpI family protein n=1 Tax=Lactobacillus sp. wkB8 TaxID=1545702 RepID=UPI00050D2015|nr:SdpI family protein [Lactobacillus sp. wkB8]AIS09606.1 hypothetical protein LACWKB8_1348 [Lactobacillus sp. wkB8]